ncbi:MAG: large-conductance mechanosensitive channel protein MscL [Fibrobacteria bacterium]|nr:large-conductance mechanosensitive channel protein MscL [Fibrobacteria bacterium]
MSLIKDFKAFISRGNVVDMAVGVVVGGAFGKIVSSFVADVVTPPLGLLIGGVDFSDLKLVIGGTEEAPVTLNYGNFLQTAINFLIVAAAIFLLVKLVAIATRKPAPPAPPAAPPPPDPQVVLLTEIRDSLRERKPSA